MTKNNCTSVRIQNDTIQDECLVKRWPKDGMQFRDCSGGYDRASSWVSLLKDTVMLDNRQVKSELWTGVTEKCRAIKDKSDIPHSQGRGAKSWTGNEEGIKNCYILIGNIITDFPKVARMQVFCTKICKGLSHKDDPSHTQSLQIIHKMEDLTEKS